MSFRKKLVHGDFMQGSLIVPYTHNIPAKDFFKVRINFFQVIPVIG